MAVPTFESVMRNSEWTCGVCREPLGVYHDGDAVCVKLPPTCPHARLCVERSTVVAQTAYRDHIFAGHVRQAGETVSGD